MANNKTKSELVTELKETKKQLKEKSGVVENMQSQINDLLEKFDSLNQTTSDNASTSIFSKKIKVVSLIDYPLYLTTEKYGGGKQFDFPHYGYEHYIRFEDLENIVHITRSFAESGVYYIADKEAVSELGLDDVYAKILTKDKIEEIINLESKTCVSLFSGASVLMQESIVDRILKNIKDGHHYDLNLLSDLSEVYGKDIEDMSKK